MKIVSDLSDNDLARSTLAEIAKAKNEIQSAQRDIDKANSRLGFLIVLANEQIHRGDNNES